MRNLIISFVAVGIAACAATPHTQAEKNSLDQQAQATLNAMTARDPSLGPVLASAAGYAVFPNVGKGGFIAGGAHGQGVLYAHGQRVGFVDLTQASFGAQAGAQSFAELLVLRQPYDVEKIRNNNFSLGANLSGVVLSAGAAASAETTSGVNVFVMPKGGLMAEASVSGQQIRFHGG